MLTIHLFGPPRIMHGPTPVALPRRRVRALVFYLAAQSSPVSREALLQLLWPDHERTAAQQLLRTTLHAARRALGAALQGDDLLQIDPDVAVDYRTLMQLVAADAPAEAGLATALAEARGSLLADFALSDAEPFSLWLDSEREHAQMLLIRAAARLAQLAAARHDYRAAQHALERALQLDPLQEDLQREAMRFHYRAGDRVGAIRRYEQLRDLLDAELGLPPMPETQALYDALITDALPPPSPAAHGRTEDEFIDAEEGKGTQKTLLPSPLSHHAGEGAGGEGQLGSSNAPFLKEGKGTQKTLLPFPLSRHAGEGAGGEGQLGSSNAPFSIPFAGRSAELARIEQALAQGQLVLIEGEAGIGKTRLARELLLRAEATGALILVGTGRELEQNLPYQGLITALRGLAAAPTWPPLRQALPLEALWLHEAARLVPELAPSGPTSTATPQAEEARLWEGVARLLLALSTKAPLYLLLDDAHWADASSLGLLAYLLRRAPGAPLHLLLTARPLDPRGPLATLATSLTREGRIERVALQRLAPAATESLARSVCPHNPAPLAAWLQHNAEGNPYIMSELLNYAREQHLLNADGQLQLPADAPLVVPHTVYSLIEARLVRLSDAARRILDAGVAVGRNFAFALVAHTAACAEEVALDALDELQAARLIVAQPDGCYSFDHSLTMEVAYRQMGQPRYQALQRRVAESLERLHHNDLDAVAGLIATHLAAGGAHERAASYALRAGQRAAAVAAWAEAVGFYQQALRGAPAAQRFELLLALGTALHQQGASQQAVERLHEALQVARSPNESNRARLSLASMLVPLARYDDVITLVREVVASGDAPERARALFRWGTALSLAGVNLAEAALRLREAQRIIVSLPTPDPVALAQIQFELGGVAAQQGDLPRSLAAYQEALQSADSADDSNSYTLDGALTWRILARNNLAYHLHLTGDLERAEQYIKEGRALAEAQGVLGLLPYLHSTAGEIALARGEVEHAETCFQRGLRLAEQLAIPERIAGLTANLGLSASARGDAAQARGLLQSALRRADGLGTNYLAAQIHIWLAPLLPSNEAKLSLQTARSIANQGGYRRLLEEIERWEHASAQPPGVV
ncbi:ATP-binding protein [Candidatus Viridilinea mediisalina]|nr:AAA family ATPase [Candidatus Viridilinea mediisalina]